MRCRFLLWIVGITMASYAQNPAVELSANTRNTIFMQQLQSFQNNANEKIQGLNANSSLTRITQIGSGNLANTTTTSNSSTSINYLQNGNQNSIYSYSEIPVAREAIIQNGNNNSFFNYSIGPVDTSSLSLYQSGNNLSFEKYGTNSQSNNLSVILTGDNRSVIVRSY